MDKTIVVYIITQLELGGAQKVCLALYNQRSNDHFITALITSNQGILASQMQDKPLVFMIPHLRRNISFKTIIDEIRTFFYIVQTLRTLKKSYQHVIVHTHSTKAGLLGRLAAFIARIPTRIHTIHGYGFHDHQPWTIWLPIYLLELGMSFITTHFVCVSSADIKTGMKLFPRFHKKHSLIRAAIDSKPFEQTRTAIIKRSPDIFIFGTIACFKPQKNMLDLLRAFTHVYQLNPNTRLEIIGDGIMRADIEQWIMQYNLQHAVLLHGWQNNVVSIMQQWHAFTLSSLWEGLPCAIIEARILKLPVICYDTGGISDVIVHERNGLLCSQKNWQQLAHNMLHVANDRSLYQQLAHYNDDLHSFTYESMIADHQTLYKQFTV